MVWCYDEPGGTFYRAFCPPSLLLALSRTFKFATTNQPTLENIQNICNSEHNIHSNGIMFSCVPGQFVFQVALLVLMNLSVSVQFLLSCLFVCRIYSPECWDRDGKLGYQEPGRTSPNFFTQTGRRRINLAYRVQNVILYTQTGVKQIEDPVLSSAIRFSKPFQMLGHFWNTFLIWGERVLLAIQTKNIAKLDLRGR